VDRAVEADCATKSKLVVVPALRLESVSANVALYAHAAERCPVRTVIIMLRKGRLSHSGKSDDAR
jgi:hypothetical protein